MSPNLPPPPPDAPLPDASPKPMSEVFLKLALEATRRNNARWKWRDDELRAAAAETESESPTTE